MMETVNKEGLLHSYDDKPASYNVLGDKFWYKDGLLHRLTGPAVIYSNGLSEYWINGRRYSLKTWVSDIRVPHEIKTETLLTMD